MDNSSAVSTAVRATVGTVTSPDATLKVHPVILAGGSGMRLWPMSREQSPKQLINLLDNNSLLQDTIHRVESLSAGLPLAERLVVVVNEEHRFSTAEQLRISGRASHVILEPAARDTAPALTVAALSIVKNANDGIMVVTPADHAIADIAKFNDTVASGVPYAIRGHIVTMGVIPTHAETGYGYIRVGAPLGTGGQSQAYLIERFVEKPDSELAQRYLTSQDYWWNSGIFIMRASTWLSAIRHFEPDILDACEAAYGHGAQDGDFLRLQREGFERSPSRSIDYAVMEHLSGDPSISTGVVLPLQAGWSDLGSWDAVWQISAKDAAGNVAQGRVMLEDTTSTLAYSGSRLVACVGTRDLVVVETVDAILVADRSRAQDVKKIVSRIRATGSAEAANHRKVHRPWGYYDSIDKGERFQVKRIVVNPGARLSLQMHHHRAEHWVVVRGTAVVTRGEERLIVSENESVYIPLGVTHRLENPGKMPLEIIEVQSGAYLGEDDIVRFDDTYGRR